MAIVGILSLIICIIGLIVWLAMTKFSSGTWVKIAEWCFVCGLLAFLIASGSQSCAIGTSGGGGGAAQHR